jgi:hypothetical protein
MTREGLTLLVKALLVLALIVVGAIVRTLAGPSRRRGEIFLVGAVAGLTGGVFAAYLMSFVVEADLSGVTGPIGMIAGYCAALPIVQRVPRSSD